MSVKEAQDQFGFAIDNQRLNIKIWGTITGVLIVSFFISIYCMFQVKPSVTWDWTMIYYTVLRLTFLGFIGTLLAFSLKTLKSYMHMKEHNLHRQRIANSMAAFAESATTKEQRDLILSRLVDSVATFGSSGMLGNDEDGNSKITIDYFYFNRFKILDTSNLCLVVYLSGDYIADQSFAPLSFLCRV